MRASLLASIAVFFAAAVGCSAAGNSQFTTGAGAGTAGGAGGAGNGTATGTGGLNFGGGLTTGTGTGGGAPGCTTAAELVYVLSLPDPNNPASQGSIWSFAPDTKQFTSLVDLSCPLPNDGNTWEPNSMAVDRNVVAWVNYVGTGFDGSGNEVDAAGLIYQVDINAKSCTPTPAVTLPDAQWYRLGMGFSSDTSGSTSETLYVTGTGDGQANSPGLGKIAMPANTLAKVGPFTGDAKLDGQGAELTGTGDARLFGFFTTSPDARVGQIDTSTGAILSDDDVSGVAPPAAWAFSFWGGAFYLYTSPDGVTLSTVTRFDPTTKAVDHTYNLSAPMVIVGAGVSTCAPIVPPM
jgi:hypothetical protein